MRPCAGCVFFPTGFINLYVSFPKQSIRKPVPPNDVPLWSSFPCFLESRTCQLIDKLFPHQNHLPHLPSTLRLLQVQYQERLKCPPMILSRQFQQRTRLYKPKTHLNLILQEHHQRLFPNLGFIRIKPLFSHSSFFCSCSILFYNNL